MLTAAYEDVLIEMVRKDYVVYAPRTVKELKRDYRELNDVAEFADLTSSELLFVWYFSCRCSPLVDLPEEKRVGIACEKSFKIKSQLEARLVEYGSLDFPGSIKTAMRKMDSFDPGGRITAMATDRHLLRQCEQVITMSIEGITDMELIKNWLAAAEKARKMRDDILERIERGGRGVEEVSNVSSTSLEGVSRHFMKSLQ
jgi:hypothetical protein